MRIVNKLLEEQLPHYKRIDDALEIIREAVAEVDDINIELQQYLGGVDAYFKKSTLFVSTILDKLSEFGVWSDIRFDRSKPGRTCVEYAKWRNNEYRRELAARPAELADKAVRNAEAAAKHQAVYDKAADGARGHV
jgi:hypothetical protein